MILTLAGRSRNFVTAGSSNYPLLSSAYFVAPAASGGSDSNPGTQASPFLTLAHAQTAMRSGNKITYVRAGTFAFAGLTFTTSDNGCTYSNYPGEAAVLNGASSNATAFTATSGSSIWVNGFTIENYTSTGFKLAGINGFKITNNTFTNIAPSSNNTAMACISCPSGQTNLTISNNAVTSCGGPFTQVTSGGSGGIYVTDNYIMNCATAFSDNGVIYAYDYLSSMLPPYMVTNNVIGPHGTGTGNSQEALYLDDLASNCIFFGNWLYGLGRYLVQIHGGINNVLTSNVFDVTASATWGYWQYSTVANLGGAGNTLSSNILYSSSSSQPAGGNGTDLWDYDKNNTTMTNPVFAHNLYYDPHLTLTNNAIQVNPSATINPLDSTVTNANPLFVAPASNNYALGSGSPALSSPVYFLPGNAAAAGPSLAGLPPVWAPAPGNIIRNSAMTGAAIGTGTTTTPATGGTMPTNWGIPSASGVSTCVMQVGTMPGGQPKLRVRFFGTTTGTLLQIDFDTAAPAVASHAYTGSGYLSICGGTTNGVTSFNLANTAVQSTTNISYQAVTLTGVPTLFTVSCTATPAGTTTVHSYLVMGCTSGVAVDITLEIAVQQLR